MKTNGDNHEMFKRQLETQLCLDLLLKADVGTIIPWDAFTKATGRTLTKTRSSIASARRIAQDDEYRRVFATIQNVGLKRLADDEIPGTADSQTKRIRGIATRTIRALKCAKYEALDTSGQMKTNTAMTVHELIRRVSSSSTKKQIGTAVEKARAQLPIGKALKALGVVTNGEEESE